MKEPELVPVRHGHWIRTDTGEDEFYECSECGFLFVTLDGTPGENDMHYCPHCGAKLDEEETHGNENLSIIADERLFRKRDSG